MVDIPFASEARHPDDQAGRLMRLATYAAVAVASSLIVFKLVAWLLTGSLALLSTLIDSVLDVGASILNLLAVRVALEPADHDHRFGHGKAEPLAGLAQAAFIGGSALFLVFEAGSRVFDPSPVTRSGVGIAVMVVSIVATLGLVTFQKYVVRQTGSVAVKADSVHYAGDVLVNLSVIVALVLATGPGWTWVDPLFAVGIAGYLLSNAWGILRTSLNLLMDREFDEPERQRILEIARGQPKVLGVHDLRTRSSGPDRFIQLHIDMDRTLSLWDAHVVADRVEHAIRDAFPGADVLIHQDPAGLDEAHPALVYHDDRPGLRPGEAAAAPDAPGP
ncbi:cation diffusion facilitator family transporter [Roseospira visakhapatnamensis]|uniref:Cation-efflux pump FieF n=1 Tax=Roseospira visakhapatnamensis TaxID=390880 RepID=A0A7W6RBQ7_9PROT|nr:cation diffusion facilitator family transporter [Roseospira visakhapatnamensis]MBB4265216.1 ferrous-iron efflux pump FieF [Roseospira visakhapatnamensis]